MVRSPSVAAAIVTPGYWDDACKHLSRRDRVMKKLIPQFGEARLQSRGDAFTTLARSICRAGRERDRAHCCNVFRCVLSRVTGGATRIVRLLDYRDA